MYGKIAAVFCAVAALAAIALVSFPRSKGAYRVSDVRKEKLATFIPMKIGGMSGVDKPLGQTEEVIRASESILHVSDFLNREYTLGDGKTFTLYISYWEPFKEDVIKASTHTPDRCWVKAGWKNDESKKLFADAVAVDGKKFKPAYYREYSIKGMNGEYRRKVWFWFVVDGERYDYNATDNYSPNIYNYVKNIIVGALQGSPEQFFVRIDSESSPHSLMADPDFRALLKKLGTLILYEAPKTAQKGAAK